MAGSAPSHTIAGVGAAGAALLAAATALLAGLASPGYDPCAQFISELGERGAPYEALVRFAGFLPVGVLTLLFASVAARDADDRRVRWGFMLFSGVGVAYIVAAFFPCDPGCPSPGSPTQQVHSSSALLEYVGGGSGLLLIGSARAATTRRLARLALVCGVIVWIAFAGMLAPQLAAERGMTQRAAELALFGWMLAYSLSLPRAASARTRPGT